MLKQNFNENLQSEVSVQPVNNRVLIKVVTHNFPTMSLLSGNRPSTELKSKTFIAGVSTDQFKIGDEVLVEVSDMGNPDNKVNVTENENSYASVRSHIKSLSKTEYESFVKANPRVSLTEYLIVYSNSIVAVVNSKDKAK